MINHHKIGENQWKLMENGPVQGGAQVSKNAENVEKFKNYEMLAGLDGSDRIFFGTFTEYYGVFWYVSSKF